MKSKFILTLSLGWILADLASAAVVPLSGSDHTGFLSLSEVNTESVQPGSGLPGAKNLPYPYYYNAGTGFWSFIAAEPLSAGSTYAEEASFTVLGKTITDAAFGSTNFGSITYDAGALTGSGTETILLTPSAFALNLAPFGPRNGTRNVNNEFNWDYVVESFSFVSGAEPVLTFTNGTLSSIDGELNVGVAVRLAGNNSAKFKIGSNSGPVATYDGTLSFAGGQFAFDIDETQDVSSFFGALSDTRLVLNREGSIAAVAPIPEPSTALLGLAAVAGALFVRRRSAPHATLS